MMLDFSRFLAGRCRSASMPVARMAALRAVAAIALVLSGHGTPAAADQTAAVIGCSVGSQHLYCTDPQVLALRDAMAAAWPAAQKTLGMATMVEMEGAYRTRVMSCGGDRSCITRTAAERAGTLRGWAYPDPDATPQIQLPVAGGPGVPSFPNVPETDVLQLLECDGTRAQPHCDDPETRALAAANIASLAEAMQVDPSLNSILMHDRIMMKRTLAQCAGDPACVRQTLTLSIETVRGMTGLPPLTAGGTGSSPQAVLDDVTLAALSAAEDAARTEHDFRTARAAEDAAAAERQQAAQAELRAKDLARRARATAEAYDAAWTAAVTALDPHPQSLDAFTRIYESPQDWVARRERDCFGDPACLAQVTFDGERMAAVAAQELERGRQRAAAQAALEEKRAEEAARQERQRLEAEARLREGAERLSARLAPQAVDTLLPAGSPLRLLVDGEFEALDAQLLDIVRREYSGNLANTIGLLAGEYQAERIRQGIEDNRRNFFAAHYAHSRFRLIGACGDSVEKFVIRSVSGTETRTLSGRVVDRSQGFDVYATLPRQFVRYANRTGIESSNRFTDEIRAMGCEHPLRRIVERTLMTFAEGREFVDWRQACEQWEADPMACLNSIR